jgi:hypothetical protein
MIRFWNTVTLDVSDKIKTYESTTNAWKVALEKADILLGGGCTYDGLVGPTLLALSAWHLYPPRIVAYHPKTVAVTEFQDLLFKDKGQCHFLYVLFSVREYWRAVRHRVATPVRR